MINFQNVKPARHRDNPKRKLAALARRLAEKIKRRESQKRKA